MALVLAFETTTDVCSVALGDGITSVEKIVLAERNHNAMLLPTVDQVLSASSWSRSDIACVAFSAGPGSFTGVRIAAAAAQGIGLALNIPVCPIGTSLVQAEIARIKNPELVRFEVVRRSRRNLMYVASFLAVHGGCKQIKPDQLVDEDYYEFASYTVYDKSLMLDACTVLNIALKMQSNWVDSSQALPFYVEGDTPWIPTS